MLGADYADASRRDGIGAPPVVPDHEESVSSQVLNFMALELDREPMDREAPSTSGVTELEFGFEREPIDREGLLKRSQPPFTTGGEFERLREFIVADDADDEEEVREVEIPTLDQPERTVKSVARRLRRPNESVIDTRPKESLRDLTIPLVSC